MRRLRAARLSRDRADRRRSHQLRREPAGRAEARHAGEADPASTCRSSSGCGCRRSIRSRPIATCSTRLANEPRLMPHLHLSLQAGDDLILKRMKRRHLRADADRVLRAGAAAAAGHRVRRRHHRRLPDRDRGDVRALARSRRRMRADASARLSVLAAPRHAGRAHAAGRRATSSRSAPGGCARRARRRCARHLDAQVGATRRVLTESRRHRPHRAIHAGAARHAGRARR